MSVNISGHFARDSLGVSHSCFGVDIQAIHPAPIGKGDRVDISLDGDDSLASELLLNLLNVHEPLVPRPGENVTVLHDAEDAGVILFHKPRQSDSSGGEVAHGPSPDFGIGL